MVTKEKLLVDLIYFKRRIPEYVKISLVNDIQMKRLLHILRRIKSKALKRRILQEVSRLTNKDWFEEYEKEHLF